MKNTLSITLILFLCSLVYTETKGTQKVDVIAEEFNFEPNDTSSKGAVSHGLASNTGYSLPPGEEEKYIVPTLVERIPNKSEVELPEPSAPEIVEEVPTTVEYYDGAEKLSGIKINCHIYSQPDDCYKQSSCGWCNSKEKCILGNNLGPLEACIRSTYSFALDLPKLEKKAEISPKQQEIKPQPKEDKPQGIKVSIEVQPQKRTELHEEQKIKQFLNKRLKPKNNN